MIKFDSIRWRLVASYVLITVLSVSLVGVLTLTLLGEFIHSQAQAQLRANAEAIAAQSSALMQPIPHLDALNNITRTLSFLSNVHIQILDADFNVIIDSGAPQQHNSVVWVAPENPSRGGLPIIIPVAPWDAKSADEAQLMRQFVSDRPSLIIRVDAGPWGRNVIVQQAQANDWSQTATSTQAVSPSQDPQASLENSVRVPIGDVSHPLGYVQVQDSHPTGEAVLQTIRRALIWAGLGAAAIAFFAGLVVSRSLTSPLKTLAESATHMASGNLAVRAPLSGADEIKRLAEQFNNMAERLQTSFLALSSERDALRRFIADASHELRTPITALSSFVELLQGPAADDPAAREEFLEECQSQVRRMEWITTHLLDLSRLDAGLVQLDLQTVSLEEFVQTTIAPFYALAEEKEIHLRLAAPEHGNTLTCDPPRLQMALDNLLENALKYTLPGGAVLLETWKDHGGVCIAVTDTGAGISPQDLPHIFERFYRGQAAQPGSGLGLAIVQAVVQLHQGTVTVESTPGQGSHFRIWLPDRDVG